MAMNAGIPVFVDAAGAGPDFPFEELENVEIRDMQVPVITNVTADYVPSKDDIKDILVKQVSNSVLWEDSIRRMLADGVDTFIEIGPGKVLQGLVAKICPEVKVAGTSN